MQHTSWRVVKKNAKIAHRWIFETHVHVRWLCLLLYVLLPGERERSVLVVCICSVAESIDSMLYECIFVLMFIFSYADRKSEMFIYVHICMSFKLCMNNFRYFFLLNIWPTFENKLILNTSCHNDGEVLYFEL